MARHRRSSAILDPDQLMDEDDAYMARRRSSSGSSNVKYASNTSRSRRGSRSSRHFDNSDVPRIPIVPFGAHMNGIVMKKHQKKIT